MPFLFLSLALLSSLSIALLLRVFEHKGGNRIVIIASNYILAGTLAYLLPNKPPTHTTVYYLGVLLGLFFFIGFTLFSKVIKSKGIAGAVTIGRLSLAIPVALSIFLWGEKPLITDILSLLMVVFVILTWEGKIGKLSPILFSLFLIFGCLDASMKFFKFKYPLSDDNFFLIIVFYSSMVWSWIYVFSSGQKLKSIDIASGLLLGIPNYFSTYFLLKALETIPAYITFPFINIGMIILSALLGYLFFKEKLSQKKIILIMLGIIAILFFTT